MDVRKLISAGIAIACAVGMALVGVTPANAAERDPMAAVAAVSPDTVANAASVPTTDTGTDAVAAAIAGTDVTVPVDPAAGISLGSGSQVVSIGLPFARNAGDASVQKSGVVSYDNNNGSTTVPVVQRDGSVQINTVIEDASAPKRYDYPISVPAGQHLQLNEDGSASVVTRLHIVATAARNAAKAGRCMQLNIPYVGPGLIYDVKC